MRVHGVERTLRSDWPSPHGSVSHGLGQTVERTGRFGKPRNTLHTLPSEPQPSDRQVWRATYDVLRGIMPRQRDRSTNAPSTRTLPRYYGPRNFRCRKTALYQDNHAHANSSLLKLSCEGSLQQDHESEVQVQGQCGERASALGLAWVYNRLPPKIVEAFTPHRSHFGSSSSLSGSSHFGSSHYSSNNFPHSSQAVFSSTLPRTMSEDDGATHAPGVVE